MFIREEPNQRLLSLFHQQSCWIIESLAFEMKYSIPSLCRFLAKVGYGTPRACVHDMGAGICKAVAEVFPGTRDLICHFHFLRDIGKDFLDPAYDELRKRLRSHAMTSRLHALVRNMRSRICGYGEAAPALMAEAIKNAAASQDTGRMPLAAAYSLALWALQGKHCGDGYGFPFDRPLLVFAERVIELSAFLSDLIHLLPTGDRQDNQPLFNLARIASRARKDIGLRQAVEELRWRSQTFDLLRKAMRIALPDGGNGLNDDGTPEVMASIRQGVAQFCLLNKSREISEILIDELYALSDYSKKPRTYRQKARFSEETLQYRRRRLLYPEPGWQQGKVLEIIREMIETFPVAQLPDTPELFVTCSFGCCTSNAENLEA